MHTVTLSSNVSDRKAHLQNLFQFLYFDLEVGPILPGCVSLSPHEHKGPPQLLVVGPHLHHTRVNTTAPYCKPNGRRSKPWGESESESESES